MSSVTCSAASSAGNLRKRKISETERSLAVWRGEPCGGARMAAHEIGRGHPQAHGAAARSAERSREHAINRGDVIRNECAVPPFLAAALNSAPTRSAERSLEHAINGGDVIRNARAVPPFLGAHSTAHPRALQSVRSSTRLIIRSAGTSIGARGARPRREHAASIRARGHSCASSAGARRAFQIPRLRGSGSPPELNRR
jgi:hypothetical protein